ncbi:anthranilate synthase component II [Lactiplantibacillus mudanjiangensis]|uniref:Aminodeoxychorismate/anthranilate synthase component II [Lactobacillus pentosus] n=1 Tax=Lactiplantibacillus mudanjiangensis TaxID=1296538 RepID=A0A660E1P0_9LACO|nr:aminodeoxychorismate/anthranilate synthase component II [Lactiplantibacillus mudanjiangensis]VDG18431.1 aminodeoxychorismate/anthranilate synthase component II [Lactobacillus pentosus] [Lactiplantibacillus mudanjiangensis]VDG25077.1 aminodeoxychorismate/anthranilate synthase component II [Lactobacillus pentosus] [Lactiplantibacillus mudanjiangensis]VDG29648.1 aminodeoxychorismate/anthranilate synthase component II [Lactobacillus pentosus] [Lactiplantibacillus mudanjiangensis]VDG33683.1 amino
MDLLIDNYDSFSYNLYQLLGSLNPDVRVIRNDELTVAEIMALHPQHLILSPGPGRPVEAGVSLAVVKACAGKVPILGVCMGHEVLVEAFGGQLQAAPTLMHGKTSLIRVQATKLFNQCPGQFQAARYHSLIADLAALPANFNVTATTADGEIMAIEDSARQLYGVQFHPESIMTDPTAGRQIVRNFLQLTHTRYALTA